MDARVGHDTMLPLSDEEAREQARWNRVLARLPRVRLRAAFARALVQGGVLLAERVIRPDYTGVDVEQRVVRAYGERFGLRVLRPKGEVRGVVVDVHGGAWVAGTARMDDLVNVPLAREHGLTVVAVEYERAPGRPIGEIVAQCAAALRFVAENAGHAFGSDRLAIKGESAGAHLALAALLGMGPQRGAYRGAALIYGVYDLGGTGSVHAAGADTLVLHGPTLVEGLEMLLPGLDLAARRDPGLSPLYADLHGLPPALLLAGGADPLEEDGVLLAAKWQAANGNCRLVRVPGAPHAFNRLPTRLARRVNRMVAEWLADAVAEDQRRAASQ